MPRGDPFDSPGFDAGSDVGVSATVGALSNLPLARGINVKGAAKQVVDIATRDALPGEGLARDALTQIRQEGMTCFVQSTQQTFQLQGGVDNVNWVDISSPASLGAKTRITDTDAIVIGNILCQSPAVAQAVRLTDNAADDARSRSVGLATTAQPAPPLPVSLQTAQGETAQCLLVPAIAGIALGQPVILSGTNGQGTIPGGAGAPAVGEVVQRVGIIIDLQGYDGAAMLLVLVQVDFTGVRRLETA